MISLVENDWHESRARHEARRCADGLSQDSSAPPDMSAIQWKTSSSNTILIVPPSFFAGILASMSSCKAKPPANILIAKTITRRSGASQLACGSSPRRGSNRSDGSITCFGRQPIERASSVASVFTNGPWSTRQSRFATRAWPLRVTAAEIAEVVRSLRIRCTHYDAFRFFTSPARPLNKYQLTRDTTSAFEQPGCLHTNMDLYKWAFKLAPFTPSDLVADCFELASRIRVLDMRASPYDLTALGYSPICIETPEGRAEYESLQRDFARMAAPLRSACKRCAKPSSRAGPLLRPIGPLPTCLGRPMIVPAAVRCWVEIDLSAIRYNAGVVRDKIGVGPGILAVVKANAYGHGSQRSLQPSPISLHSLESRTLKRRIHSPSLQRDVLLLGPSAPG